MQTKYGYITDEQYGKYVNSIIGRIYAILPMKEESVQTIRQYVESLNRELIANLIIFPKCERVMTVVCMLESIIDETEHAIYRQDVLRCCSIMSEVGD